MGVLRDCMGRVRSAEGLWRIGAIVIVSAVVGGAVGGAVGALVASDADSPDAQLQLSVPERVAAINVLVNADWPHVPSPDDWYTEHRHVHVSLGEEWVQPGGLGEFLHIDGLDPSRDDVEAWRASYADWTVETEELLQQLDHSDHHHAPLRTVHARGLRILIHVDALLDQ